MPRISVAGPSTFVTDAAAEIASAGGSVVDVAIVASLTAMCSEPGVCAPGGGGFMTIDIPDQPPIVIDGYMAYPGLGFQGTPAQHEVTMEYGGGVTTAVGPATIGVPGSFAALETASEMFGVAPWNELMEVSASALEGGFPLSQASHDYLIHSGRLIFWDDPISRRAIFDGDRLKAVGESVVFEGLAETLRHIGSEGAAVLYRGELGRSLVGDLRSRGGTLTTEDLETYRPILRTPLSLEMSGWTFWGNPPPAVGGVTVFLALKDLAETDHLDSGRLSGALVSAFETRAAELAPGVGFEASAQQILAHSGLMSPSTIAVSAVDNDGGAVAASFSGGYGSGIAPAGTGLMMNNGIGELELAVVGSPKPGTRLMSNMTPIVGRRERSVVALASPGADRITSALTSTVSRISLGFDLVSAIEHPRVHPEFGDWGVRIAAEPGIEPNEQVIPIRWYSQLHMYFGGVTGAAMLDGDLVGHADSRRTGSAVILE